MFKINFKIITTLLAISLLSQVTFARNNIVFEERNKFSELEHSLGVDSIDIPVIRWPSYFGVQQTGKLNASFSQGAQIGSGFSPYAITPQVSFETPSFSENNYLFGGGIWVGAVVGSDTLVSGAVDGWNRIQEFGLDNNPTVEKIWYPSDYSMRAECTDTITAGVPNDVISGRPHTPLNIKIVTRSHIWRNDTLDNAVFYDYLIDYMGPEDVLDSVYIGFFIDGDIYNPTGPMLSSGYFDDMAGYTDNGVIYMIDNDGDPIGSSFEDISPQKVLAFEMLSSSFTPSVTNFNWWASGSSTTDFGPRQRPTAEDEFRDFGTGGLGTPEGDANKYYMLRHKEWDYEQAYTATIGASDTMWLEPNPANATVFATGMDTRFLYSMGPIRLEKGKSERIIIANFTAESIHTDPYNLDNLPNNPDAYKSNLGLDNLISESADIKQALNVLLDPLTPPTGLQVYDYNKIKFDQFGFDVVTGHELYATPIDVSTFPFLGAIPPWYRPSSPIHVGSSIFEIPQNAIDGTTAINVAYTSDAGIGELSETAFISFNPELERPIIQSSFTSTTPDSLLLKWELPENATQPDHFKIYKYATLSEFENAYTRPYYLQGYTDAFTTDSIFVDGTMWYYQSALEEPYAIVNGNELQYFDSNFDDDYLYFIISVDEYGFESAYASTNAFLLPERDMDILIITKSGSPAFSTNPDTVINYYEKLLNGSEFSYHIYSVRDSLIDSECTDCPDWQTMSKYKFIIVDDAEYARLDWGNEALNFIANGGKLINFGSFDELMDIGDQIYSTSDWYPPYWRVDYVRNQILGIDYVFRTGILYNSPNPIETGPFGFNLAESVDPRFPSLECDTARFPLDSLWVKFAQVPTNEPLTVSGLAPSENSTVTHRYKSLYPETSLMEDMPVGIKHYLDNETNSGEIYTFGFHLYYMKYAHARDLLRSIVSSVATDITEFDTGNLPTDFKLSQNYPNPFNPTTTIEFNIPTRTNVVLNIYNLLGQQVNQLVDQDYAAGNYRVTWDGSNHAGEKIASGIYLYRLETDDYTSTKKMLLLK